MGALPAICGAVAEWSKALAWKVSIRQKRIEGSNPSRSAIQSTSPWNKEVGLLKNGAELRLFCLPTVLREFNRVANQRTFVSAFSAGFSGSTELKGCAFAASGNQPQMTLRRAPTPATAAIVLRNS